MNFNQLIAKITPEIYQNLKTSIEIGRWPSGEKLTEEQQANSLQAVLAYEIHANIPETERVGYIDRGRKKKDEVCASPMPNKIPLLPE